MLKLFQIIFIFYRNLINEVFFMLRKRNMKINNLALFLHGSETSVIQNYNNDLNLFINAENKKINIIMLVLH